MMLQFSWCLHDFQELYYHILSKFWNRRFKDNYLTEVAMISQWYYIILLISHFCDILSVILFIAELYLCRTSINSWLLKTLISCKQWWEFSSFSQESQNTKVKFQSDTAVNFVPHHWFLCVPDYSNMIKPLIWIRCIFMSK